MDFKKIATTAAREKKWQEFWVKHPGLYQAKDPSTSSGQVKQKQYILVEFPYPSGSGLHIGHAFSFTGADIYARFKRMQGYNVLFPMGWDAFGLPTENYAIKMKRKPAEVTKENTEMFKKQMKELAFSFDWEREINTTDPNYYKWTQWIFIKLFEKGLAYKQEMPINWCPSCKIGLANEEVVDGKCERCHAEVSRRNISQWVVKITEYADRLIEGLKKTAFIDKVKAAQVNWIGKSEGARIKFQISNHNFQTNSKSQITKELEVFTTRPDTLYGVTFMVIAPEHPLVAEITSNKIEEYIKQTRNKSDMERTELSKEKTGVFSGWYAINPVNNKEIPIWISDFVLNSYGTGAIMSVPAHDDRDNAFAKKYGLEIIEVVSDGVLVNSEMLNGLRVGEAKEKIIKWLAEKGIGQRSNSYHLRDWIFSRQHYWGEPIPMIFCKACAENQNNQLPNSPAERDSASLRNNQTITNNQDPINKLNAGWIPVPEDELPVKLPEVEAYEPTDDGQSPLAKMTEWVKTTCPKCGGEARRETDTMPNWAGSDWYYLRYIDSNNNSKLADFDLLKKWLPVDVYVGGDEHNTLHLLYSRFIHQFLYDLGVVPTPEPYYKRLSHGVILGPDGQRMSKSRGNVVVPDEMVAKYGVDVVRMYLMFMGPFEATMVWDEKTLNGVKRFLERFEKYISKHKQINSSGDSNKEIKVIINKLIEGVTRDLESFGFNTSIAKLMGALNQLSVISCQLSVEEIKTLIKLIAPMASYMAEELWVSYAKASEGQGSILEGYTSVHVADWPVADPKYLVAGEVVIPVAVNGKVRDQLLIQRLEIKDQKCVIKKVRELEKIRKWIEGKKIAREVYVPGRMVNLVVK